MSHQQWVSWSFPKGLQKSQEGPGSRFSFFCLEFHQVIGHFFLVEQTVSMVGFFLKAEKRKADMESSCSYLLADGPVMKFSRSFWDGLSEKREVILFSKLICVFLGNRIRGTPHPHPNSADSTKPGAQIRVGSFPLSFALGSLFLFAVMWGTKFFDGICCCNWNMQMDMVTLYIYIYIFSLGFDMIWFLTKKVILT